MSGIQVFTNDASSTLASGISDTATSLTLVAGGGSEFPSLSGGNWFIATLISQSNPSIYEIIKCTAISGDTFTTIVRAREGTTALAWNSGDYCNLQVTAGALNAFSAETMAVLSVTGGANVTVNNTNPQNPVVSAPGVALLSGASFTGNVSISGTLTTTGVANFNTSTLGSKENVRPLTLDVDSFMKLKPISYVHKASRMPTDGFSAENVAELFPELVMFKDGKPYAVNYSGLIPHTVKLIHHLKERMDELEAMLQPVKN